MLQYTFGWKRFPLSSSKHHDVIHNQNGVAIAEVMLQWRMNYYTCYTTDNGLTWFEDVNDFNFNLNKRLITKILKNGGVRFIKNRLRCLE